MARYAFKLRIKADAIEEYEREHQRVWPELLAKLKEVGISDYSVFRRGQELVLCLRVDDFERAWDELDRDPVNQRWQEFMSRLFEPVPDKTERRTVRHDEGSLLPGVSHAGNGQQAVVRVEVVDVIRRDYLVIGEHGGRHALRARISSASRISPSPYFSGKYATEAISRVRGVAQLGARLGLGILAHDRAIVGAAGLLKRPQRAQRAGIVGRPTRTRFALVSRRCLRTRSSEV